MATIDQLRKQYAQEADSLKAQTNALRARSRSFVAAEITSFLAIVFFIVLITLSHTTAARTVEGLLAVAMFGLYVVVRNRDVKNSERIADTERLRKAYANEVAYMDGDFSAFDDGERYVDPHHPFTYDLDIFGKESLYQRINRTATTGGADRLAYYLSSVEDHSSNKAPISSLQLQTAWRMRFISYGVDGKIDTDAILRSLPALRKINIPPFFGGKAIKLVAWLLVAGIFASIIAAIYGLVNPLLPILWLFVNFFVVQGLANKYLGEMLKLGNHLRDQMQALMRLIRHVGAYTWICPEDEAAKPGHTCGHAPTVLKQEMQKLKDAESSFETLTAIVETLVLRGNDAYRFFADAFGLRGIFLVCKFYRWRQTVSENLPEWIAAIAELDTLVSMAQFKSLNPITPSQREENEACQRVTVVDSSEIVFEAKGLYHPFLGEKAVRNNFSIKDRNFYIVTGANMAGKSTFLRAVGVNYILAMNGMPVFAESLTVSRFNLFTSMRTSDDLAHGISYFNAELLRLKQLIGSLSPGPTLIILDEILKGTNSLDKLNGSRLFLRSMMQYPVSGIIATHDLELSKMEEESPRFHNYCFEIELGTDVTYSYKITPGVARNQNATFLLKQILATNGTIPDHE